MSTVRFPVLILEDHEGWTTACLVDDWEHRAAVAPSRREALRSLADAVQVAVEQESLFESTFLEPQLTLYRVDVLPEYSVRGRVQPCAETVALHIPCVHGRREDAARCCSLPTLGLNFDYFEARGLDELVRHYVKNHLQGSTPRELSRHLAPKNLALDEISVRAPTYGGGPSKFVVERELPILCAVAEPLSSRRALSGRFALAFGRESLVKDLANRLREGTSSLLLVGESGVGKTTVMARLAREYAWGESASTNEAELEGVKDYRFWLTNAARLISGMKYLGQWEERCEKLMAELEKVEGFLCVENLLELASAGGASAADSVAAFLLPSLQRSELRLITEATPAELEACRRLLPGFPEVFQVARVQVFAPAEALEVAARMEASLKTTLKVEVEPGVAARVQALFGRFMPYEVFPGKAATFVRQLFQKARAERAAKLTQASAVTEFQKWTGLPSRFLDDDATVDVNRVCEALAGKVISQPAACELVARTVTAFKSGVNDPNRPVAVLLFSGPTGVGKSALAQALSEHLFGECWTKENRLVRLDMSEYAGPWAAERLLQRAHGEPSELVRSLRRQPFSVVLLDEIEKANPEVFDVLMNVFDEGKLTDNRGRVTFFRSSIIILTSNLGAQRRRAIGFAEIEPDYERAVARFFRPEFFNRLDAVVPFRSLDREAIRCITVKELQAIAAREGLVSAHRRLQWTEAAVDRLAAVGFDERYGARPLQRALERNVVAPIARSLAREPSLRHRIFQLDVDADGQLTVRLL